MYPRTGHGVLTHTSAFNLGWKVASVVKGHAKRSILKTYQSERRGIAQELIAFDHKFSRLFSGRPAKDVMDAEGISMEEFKAAFLKGHMFASGIGRKDPPPPSSRCRSTDLTYLAAVNYGASLLVAKKGSNEAQGDGRQVSVANSPDKVTSDESLCGDITVGMRIQSHKVLNQADARPWHLQELLPSNGRWRVIVFAGNVNNSEQRGKLEGLAQDFGNQNAFLRASTPASAKHDEVFELLLIHNAPRTSVTIFDFPEVFRHFDEIDGWDYNKIFVDDVSYHEGFGNIYGALGIPHSGCIVIVRPDQYVSYVGPMDDTAAVSRFFGGFMTLQQQPSRVQTGLKLKNAQ
jgi:phenol 2-monooxygenase